MADQNLPPDPPYGSVESYTQLLRRVVRNADFLDAAALGIVQSIVGDGLLGDDMKVARIKNVVAAASLLDAEKTQPSPLLYARPADGDEPQQVGAREPLHTGAVTEAGLVDETERPAMAASGLTLAADKSRGPLAGTTPVVTYFSFGHGQTDPANGKKLLDHYVTVVAPTYEECREAMFASRFGRAWSFDYLAGRERTTEWVSRWAEHEVIVAPGVAEMDAERALTAAKMLLTDDPGPCWHGDIAPGRECPGSGPDCGPAF